jgi:hypothetical protein
MAYGLDLVSTVLSSRKAWHVFFALLIVLLPAAGHADYGEGDVPRDARWASLQDRPAIPLAKIGENVLRVTAKRGLDGVGAFKVVLRRDAKGIVTGQIEFFRGLRDELVPDERQPGAKVYQRKYEGLGIERLFLDDRHWSLLEHRVTALFAEADAMRKDPDPDGIYVTSQDGTAMLTEWRANGRSRWIDSETGSERYRRAIRSFLLRAVWEQSCAIVDRWQDCEPLIAALDKTVESEGDDGADAGK